MHGPGRNIAAASHSIRVRPAVHDQYHLAAQYDVCGFRVMRMLRIKRVRLILPNIGMAKSLALQLLRQLSLVQTRIPPFVEGSVPSVLQPFTLSSQLRRQHFASKHGYAPSALMGADAERACRLQERRSLFCLHWRQLKRPRSVWFLSRWAVAPSAPGLQDRRDLARRSAPCIRLAP